jgi:hypothetical protein
MAGVLSAVVFALSRLAGVDRADALVYAALAGFVSLLMVEYLKL